MHTSTEGKTVQITGGPYKGKLAKVIGYKAWSQEYLVEISTGIGDNVQVTVVRENEISF